MLKMITGMVLGWGGGAGGAFLQRVKVSPCLLRLSPFSFLCLVFSYFLSKKSLFILSSFFDSIVSLPFLLPITCEHEPLSSSAGFVNSDHSE